MGNLYLSSDYKNTIINLLLSNQNFVKLINPQQSECPQITTENVLLGGTWIYNGKKYNEQGHIFDYNFVDETTTDEKTFVFVETDIDTVRQNLFTDFNLYVCIFSYFFRASSISEVNFERIPTTGPRSLCIASFSYLNAISMSTAYKISLSLFFPLKYE